jgi:hypothetical protein
MRTLRLGDKVRLTRIDSTWECALRVQVGDEGFVIETLSPLNPSLPAVRFIYCDAFIPVDCLELLDT